MIDIELTVQMPKSITNLPNYQITKFDIGGMDRSDLDAALIERGHEAFRARQVFRWLYRRGAADFGEMSDLPQSLREELARDFTIETPHIAARERSSDGTEKLLLNLGD